MKRVAGILTVGIAMAAAAVYAQDRGMTVDVPFMFYAGHTLMPAGAYKVAEMPNTSVAWFMPKEASAAKAISTINLVGKQDVEPARLVFRRYGEDYFLAEIWTGSGPVGRALPRSDREKELARSGATPIFAVLRVALH